jgi:serine phosphatase RsbU (regulator of sigma subunit)
MAVSESGAWLGVGDAVGKGLGASALSALAVSAQRSVRQAGGSLNDAAWAIHEAVLEGGADDAFMTIVLAEWDARDHTLSWINCGHPCPLVRRADGDIADLESPRTVPVGIAEMPPKIRVSQTPIAADDLVLIYSDGVYERRTASGEGFGAARIRDVLSENARSAAAAIATLQRAVLDAGPGALRDDATMLALRALADDKREPPVPGPGA